MVKWYILAAHHTCQAGKMAYRLLVWQVAWYGASPNPGGLVRRRKACPFPKDHWPVAPFFFFFPFFIFADRFCSFESLAGRIGMFVYMTSNKAKQRAQKVTGSNPAARPRPPIYIPKRLNDEWMTRRSQCAARPRTSQSVRVHLARRWWCSRTLKRARVAV